MSRLAQVFCVCALAVLVAVPASAQEKKKERRKRADRPAAAADAQMLNRLKEIGLTTEQLDKVKSIQAEYKAKLTDVGSDVKITPEQRQAATKARIEAQAQGKEGKELQEAATKAMNLSEEQVKAREKLQELRRKMDKEIAEVLTPEQREKLKELRKAAAAEGKKPRNKKK
jgi:Spy/CpxP family protein refolding chaperone